MDFWPFVRTLPREMTSFACQVFDEGFAEVERLQELKDTGTEEKKVRAADQLERLGVPGIWFHRRFCEKYPGFTQEQTNMLFAFAARASL
ncbi:MAG: hypothetical protein ABSF41_18110 [Pseudolabrys sp.]